MAVIRTFDIISLKTNGKGSDNWENFTIFAAKFRIVYEEIDKNNGSASRNNPKCKVERLPSGDRRDYASVAQIAKDWHHQHILQAYELRTEH
jgi:hypothetical protein